MNSSYQHLPGLFQTLANQIFPDLRHLADIKLLSSPMCSTKNVSIAIKLKAIDIFCSYLRVSSMLEWIIPILCSHCRIRTAGLTFWSINLHYLLSTQKCSHGNLSTCAKDTVKSNQGIVYSMVYSCFSKRKKAV